MKFLTSLLYTLVLFHYSAITSNHTEHKNKKQPSETVEKDCFDALLKAVKTNNHSALKKILESGCDPNKKIVTGYSYYTNDSTYQTALSISTDYDITKLLLQAGADPNAELGQRTPLETAIVLRKNKTVKLLAEYGADVNYLNKYTEYQRPLIAAVSTGNIEALKILNTFGARLQANEENVHSPIHKAIYDQQYETAEFLLKGGVDPNLKITPPNLEGDFGDCIPCPFGVTALHEASQIMDVAKAKKFIDLLMAYGADANAKNHDGLTPLSYISFLGNYEIAKHLVSKGITMDDIAVINAASFQNVDLLKVLLENGGNPNARSDQYESALLSVLVCCGDGFNEFSNHKKVLRINTLDLLLKHGAKPTEQMMLKIKNEEPFMYTQEIFKKYGFE